MDKIGEYIRRIEIDSLWSGQKHIVWELNRKVNILSGVNGVGKSTILNKVILRLLQVVKDGCPAKPDVKLTYEPADAVTVRFDVVRSFDRPLVHSNLLEKLADDRVATELDWQLYLLQRRFLDYQVNVGNRMIALLTSGDPEARERRKWRLRPGCSFKIWWTSCSARPERKSSVAAMKYNWSSSARYFRLTNSLPARSRCS